MKMRGNAHGGNRETWCDFFDGSDSECSKLMFDCGSGDRIKTTGFRVFEWYVRVTVAAIVFAAAPLILMYLLSSPLPGSQRFTWSKTFSRQTWKRSERVRRGLYHRLLNPIMRQAIVYTHVALSNFLFFSVGIWLLAKIPRVKEALSPGVSSAITFEQAALYALIPTAIMFVASIAFHFMNRFLQYKDPMPVRYMLRAPWRSVDKLYDKIDDNVINLMFREQIRDAISVTSMSRLDRQLLLGIPTALVALVGYIIDVGTGEQQEAESVREEASRHVGGVSTSLVRGLGLFRA